MLALIAAILWLLHALGVHAPISLPWLGAVFFALQFAFPIPIPWPSRRP
jgi:hypothetical protein